MTERDKATKKTEHLQLNIGETIGNQQKNHKEETTMKKRTTMMAMVMVVMAMVLTACGPEPQQQAVTTTTPEPTQVAEVKPTEAPVATEAPAPTEEPTPTEAPTPTESQYMVDGYDFAEFYESEKTLDEVVQTWDNDSARVIVVTWGENVEAVLKDGDSLVMDEEIGAYYMLYVCVPKKATGITTTVEDFIRLHNTELEKEENREKMPYKIQVASKGTGTNVECPFTITYEDGTEEKLTLYITKEYEARY